MPGQRQHTLEQEDAIRSAVVEHGMSYAKAQRAARAGTLPAGLPPFEIPYGTVAAYGGAARREHAAAVVLGRADEIADNVLRELLLSLERKAKRLAREKDPDTAKILALAKAVAAVRDVARESKGAQGKAKRGDSDDFIGGLAAVK